MFHVGVADLLTWQPKPICDLKLETEGSRLQAQGGEFEQHNSIYTFKDILHLASYI
jgi:hypothetical protein